MGSTGSMPVKLEKVSQSAWTKLIRTRNVYLLCMFALLVVYTFIFNYKDNVLNKSGILRTTEKDEQLKFALTIYSPLLINNPSLCQTNETLFVVFVHSALDHFYKRSAIRDTWANDSMFDNISIVVVFMVGRSNDMILEETVHKESDKYRDIIKGDFIDSYRNLTHKGVMGFRWIKEYCPGADLVIKVDDDIYLNMFFIVNKIYPVAKTSRQKMFCEKIRGGPIHRKKAEAWRVDEDDFKEFQFYPTFCRGPVVIFTPDLIPKLFESAKQVPFFWIDDVYLYGMLPLVVTDVTFLDFKKYISMRENRCLEKYSKGLNDRIMACNSISRESMTQLHLNSYKQWQNQKSGGAREGFSKPICGGVLFVVLFFVTRWRHL